jgi:hypothetical protein
LYLFAAPATPSRTWTNLENGRMLVAAKIRPTRPRLSRN